MANRFEALVKEKTSEELLEMVYQFDSWDPEMLKATEDELNNRGLLPGDIQVRRNTMIDEAEKALAEGKQASIGGQILGWLGVLGLLGLIIGYNYVFSKTRSRYTGKVYPTFNADTRDNGNYIFYISLTVHIAAILYYVVNLV